MIKYFKTALLLVMILFFIFVFTFIRCVLIFFPKLRQILISHLIHAFGKMTIFIMGIKINILGKERLLNKKGVFFVTNHVSYLDGIIASSIFPLIFIARGDLKKWPLFGIFSSLSETIFVNRMSSLNLQKEIKKISSFLKNGVNIILFPEGTTSSDGSISSFKSSFFEAPLNSGASIIPFTIKYIKINGKDINDENKDLIFWYGDMEFLPHLLKFLGLKSITAEVKILNTVEVSGMDDRKQLSNFCQNIIVTNLS